MPSRTLRTVVLALAFALVAALAGCSSTGGHRNSGPPDTTTDPGLTADTLVDEPLEEPTSTTGPELDLAVGDTAAFSDGVRMTVLDLKRNVRPSYPEAKTNRSSEVVGVTVKVVNGSPDTIDLAVTLSLTYGKDGREAESFYDENYEGINEPSRLRKGRAATGRFGFEVRPGAKWLVFEGAPGFEYEDQQWTA
jgi:hypothetical protein